MEKGFTQEQLQDLIYIGAFHYEALLRERNLVNDETEEIKGVVPYATWEVLMLAGLCNLNVGQLYQALKGIESPSSWESLLSERIIDPQRLEELSGLSVGRKYLPNAYIRSKATVLGVCRKNRFKDFAEKILAHNCPLTSFSIASNGFESPVFCDS